MAQVNEHYDGVDAKKIRQITIAALKTVLTAALEEAGETIGKNGMELLRSVSAASKRLQEGKAFVLLAPRPTKTESCNVQGTDGVHSGERLYWTFVVQASRGNIGGKVTSESTAASDDEIMDAVRSALSSRYPYFRDDLKFFDFAVTQSDDPRVNGSILNPLTVTFYNKIRLPQDRYLTI